jgi:hypothetical protein
MDARPVVSEDYKQKMRDATGELLLQLATGEISAGDAQREVEICKALDELIRIAIEMGALWPPEERYAAGSNADCEMAGSVPSRGRWCDTHAGSHNAGNHIICWARKLMASRGYGLAGHRRADGGAGEPVRRGQGDHSRGGRGCRRDSVRLDGDFKLALPT